MLSNPPTDVGVVEKAECRIKVKDKWKKGLISSKVFLHRSSGFPSCLGSYWAVAICTVLGHFLNNTFPLERSGV